MFSTEIKNWVWSDHECLSVSSKRSFTSVLEIIKNKPIVWVVIVRTYTQIGQVSASTEYYTYLAKSLYDQSINFSKNRLDMALEESLNLEESQSSFKVRNSEDAAQIHSLDELRISFGQADPVDAGADTPEARAVQINIEGEIIAIGYANINEPINEIFIVEVEKQESLIEENLGDLRGIKDKLVEEAASTTLTELVDTEDEYKPDFVTLSAETKREIKVGQIELIEFKIELADYASPLANAITTSLPNGDEKIRIIATTPNNDLIKIIGERVKTTIRPNPKNPSSRDFFEIEAIKAGSARIALSFRMGGTELGVITLATEVVKMNASQETASGFARAINHDPADDVALDLLIESKIEGNRIWYEYKLNSEKLGFNYLTVNSRPLLAHNNNPAQTSLEYVKRLYNRVTPKISTKKDLQRLTQKLKEIGSEICGELFDPEVTKQLWPLRDQIKMIKITSWEPYIPWELICLQHPETGEVDNRFLCEYGLIRAEAGQSSPRTLSLNNWAYLAADFPYKSMKSVGAEVSYFTNDLPEVGVHPVSIRPDHDSFFDALQTVDFDVLHISCHGEASHENIESSVLILGDKIGAGGSTVLIKVDPTDIKSEAKSTQNFSKRRPLVFLNGCETARIGSLLTTWGGWPSVFNQIGASVFIGTSWPVRDKPASLFAKTFYDSLRANLTLAEAATAARTKTKELGDASWLAFKVYGNPQARNIGPTSVQNNQETLKITKEEILKRYGSYDKAYQDYQDTYGIKCKRGWKHFLEKIQGLEFPTTPKES